MYMVCYVKYADEIYLKKCITIEIAFEKVESLFLQFYMFFERSIILHSFQCSLLN